MSTQGRSSRNPGGAVWFMHKSDEDVTSPLLPRDYGASSQSEMRVSATTCRPALYAWLVHALRSSLLRRCIIYVGAFIVAFLVFIVTPPLYEASLFANRPQHQLGLTSASQILKDTIRYVKQDVKITMTPEECTKLDFDEAGWVLHSSVEQDDSENLPWYRQESLERPGTPKLRTLASQSSMSQACTDLWISQEKICLEISQGEGLPEVDVDFAWTFVEPSNHWERWKDAFVKGDVNFDLTKGTRNKNFREHNQLMYSVRSVLNLLPFVKKGTLLSASLPVTRPIETTSLEEDFIGKDSAGASCRVMQTPLWLNASMATQNSSRLQLLSHWDLFHSSEVKDLITWRRKVLPAFNSHAMESQLVNIPNQSELLIYMNDDFYIGRSMAPSDFGSVLYGPVYRVKVDKWLVGTSDRERLNRYNPENRNKVSEWTAGLINERFGKRDRNWLCHVAYTTSVPMMQEAATIWSSELRETAEARFRGRGVETYLPLLATLYNIERHREALLWSFFMARSDTDGSGTYSLAERAEMLATLGGRRTGNQHGFRMPDRPVYYGTYSDPFEEVSLEAPRETEIKWSSRDGYFYMATYHRTFPNLDGRPSYFCKISLQKCFGSEFFFDRYDEDMSTTSDWLFKNMAYADPKCGDCIIAGLITSSGRDGLEAFLPKVGQLQHLFPMTASDGRIEVPYLGDTNKEWIDQDVSLRTTLRDRWTPRDFAVRLIQRYSYVIGDSPYVFDKFDAQTSRTSRLLDGISTRDPRHAFVALNDGLPDDTTDAEAAENDRLLRDWHEKMWEQPTAFELPLDYV